MPSNFSFIDLFAGIGGFKMALSQNGGKCLGFSEINNDAINAYCENYAIPQSHNFGDITKIKELPKHDILTAGVPCQSWSQAGKNLGFDDDRGQLWNDTIFLLQQSKPKAFIFENVKGLVDPRNKNALSYILDRIKDAGYYAKHYVLNSFDYGVPQNRLRVYIIGFIDKTAFDNFTLPQPINKKVTLSDILGVKLQPRETEQENVQYDLFGNIVQTHSMSLSNKDGFNDYFLFNDLRNGETTVHSWDIIDTSDRQKDICLLLLRNRRKKVFGKFDGNPLSLKQFQSLDSTISVSELSELVKLDILKKVNYQFEVKESSETDLTDNEQEVINSLKKSTFVISDLKTNRTLKIKKMNIGKVIDSLLSKGRLVCSEVRYDFKNTKISTGLFGVNRIFLPSSDMFPTLAASETNDYVTLEQITPSCHNSYKKEFIEKVYKTDKYRKITKSEACHIQGFPETFILPENRARWMKLIGNSVSVPVIDVLIKAIIETGCFQNRYHPPLK